MSSRKIPEINAGSMADIAFLLLVFFLVTTTIQTDSGVNTVLPPYIPPEVELDPPKINPQNLCAIQINAQNEIRVRKQPMQIDEIRGFIYDFMSNRGRRSDMSDSPEAAVVSLINDNGTAYETYLGVYDEIKAACNKLRDEQAQADFGRMYEKLTKEQQKEVRMKIPCLLSEAEPTGFGDEK